MRIALLLALQICTANLFAETTTHLLFKCPIPLKKQQFYASIFHIEAKKLFHLSSMFHSTDDADEMLQEHNFMIPNDCAGSCLVFIDKDYRTPGAEVYKLEIKVNEKNALTVSGQGCMLTISFCNEISSRIKRGDRLATYVFRITKDGVDPLFLNAINLNPLMSDSSYMYVYGAMPGDYLYGIYDLGSGLPVYSRLFHIKSNEIVNGLLWFNDSQRNELRTGISISLTDDDAWLGFAGISPFDRDNWWSERYVVNENGEKKLIGKSNK